MATLTVLMVAEKPSIAQTLAAALCPSGERGVQKRKGVSPSSPVYEYYGDFRGEEALFKVTATTGHMYSLDFSQECNNWDKVSPGDLFHAPTVRCYDPRARIPEHIRSEASNANALVLWLDCDREGENICFEVIGEASPQMSPRQWPDAYEGYIFRAQFSSLAAIDLQEAMQNRLGPPDIRQSHSVDARQEIDLRLGVAFSRLQTMYFRTHFGHQLGKKMVTYGPCQFPTLWFCVRRHCEIEDFIPVPYWNMHLTVTISGTAVKCYRPDSFYESLEASTRLSELRSSVSPCKVKRVRAFRSKIHRPLPLNTVALLRMASDELGLGPGDALHYAEQLYLKGITSYPRTETDKYPQNFDLEGTVRTLANPQAPWFASAQALMSDGITEPRQDGYDAGDHPPITPVKFTANAGQCGGEAGYALYSAICTHFLASISPDCIFDNAEMHLDVGGEQFVANSSRCFSRGWLDVDNRTASDKGPVDLRSYVGREGEELPVQGIDIEQLHTQPPGHLRESELLGLMEQHQIGTDASMATHVSNVQKRVYVELDENTRELHPSALGLALAHAYALIDQTLILPSVRARIENECSNVAKGSATKESVVRRTMRTFERKFNDFALRIDRLPMMLAVAYAQEKGADKLVGNAAGQGLAMWEEARAKQRSITLEGLLAEHENVVFEDDSGDLPPSNTASDLVKQRSEAVQLVQQALEELGFGSAQAPPEPQPKKQPKAKPNPAGTGSGVGADRSQAAPPTGMQQPMQGGNNSKSDAILGIVNTLQAAGTLTLAELFRIHPGIKKKDLEMAKLFHITGQGNQCQVRLHDSSSTTAKGSPNSKTNAEGGQKTKGPKGAQRGKKGSSGDTGSINEANYNVGNHRFAQGGFQNSTDWHQGNAPGGWPGGYSGNGGGHTQQWQDARTWSAQQALQQQLYMMQHGQPQQPPYNPQQYW